MKNSLALLSAIMLLTNLFAGLVEDVLLAQGKNSTTWTEADINNAKDYLKGEDVDISWGWTEEEIRVAKPFLKKVPSSNTALILEARRLQAAVREREKGSSKSYQHSGEIDAALRPLEEAVGLENADTSQLIKSIELAINGGNLLHENPENPLRNKWIKQEGIFITLNKFDSLKDRETIYWLEKRLAILLEKIYRLTEKNLPNQLPQLNRLIQQALNKFTKANTEPDFIAAKQFLEKKVGAIRSAYQESKKPAHTQKKKESQISLTWDDVIHQFDIILMQAIFFPEDRTVLINGEELLAAINSFLTYYTTDKALYKKLIPTLIQKINNLNYAFFSTEHQNAFNNVLVRIGHTKNPTQTPVDEAEKQRQETEKERKRQQAAERARQEERARKAREEQMRQEYAKKARDEQIRQEKAQRQSQARIELQKNFVNRTVAEAIRLGYQIDDSSGMVPQTLADAYIFKIESLLRPEYQPFIDADAKKQYLDDIRSHNFTKFTVPQQRRLNAIILQLGGATKPYVYPSTKKPQQGITSREQLLIAALQKLQGKLKQLRAAIAA